MLIIGSAGIKAGKTALACALINKYGRNTNITGIKVTTIKAKNGKCPRGGQGCGVCSSLDGDFCITEELKSDSKKDTARLLAAGASRVFWLRVMQTHLKEGISTLLDIIGPDAVLICESNSLRQVVEPGLFLMVKTSNQKRWKSSAHQVKKYVDAIVTFNDGKFDLDINRIKLIDGTWAMQEKATAIIMAGGKSERTGQDKSMLPIEGRPMIKHIYNQLSPHFSQILISSNDSSKYNFIDAKVVPDKIKGLGPLMGVASALKASDNKVNFVIACDIPEVDMTLVRTMLKLIHAYDAVVPKTGPFQYEPLFAVYKRDVLAVIEDSLSSGQHRIIDALTTCRVRYINLTGEQKLKNINTMNDYWKFVEREK
jgi:molybdopterin-guanine dinucleotide biosynthesis protein A